MNLLQQLESRIREELPDVHATLDLAVAPETSSWLDLTLRDHRATIEWRPGRGFGVSSSPEPVYGEGPDEIYPDVPTTLKRVVAILRKRSRTNPGRPTLVRQQEAHMSEKKEMYIERRPQGDYAVRRPNSERASTIEDTQAKAIDSARQLEPGAAILVERVRHTSKGKPDKWRKP